MRCGVPRAIFKPSRACVSGRLGLLRLDMLEAVTRWTWAGSPAVSGLATVQLAGNSVELRVATGLAGPMMRRGFVHDLETNPHSIGAGPWRNRRRQPGGLAGTGRQTGEPDRAEGCQRLHSRLDPWPTLNEAPTLYPDPLGLTLTLRAAPASRKGQRPSPVCQRRSVAHCLLSERCMRSRLWEPTVGSGGLPRHCRGTTRR